MKAREKRKLEKYLKGQNFTLLLNEMAKSSRLYWNDFAKERPLSGQTRRLKAPNEMHLAYHAKVLCRCASVVLLRVNKRKRILIKSNRHKRRKELSRT